jgi:hypothetical protein
MHSLRSHWFVVRVDGRQLLPWDYFRVARHPLIFVSTRRRRGYEYTVPEIDHLRRREDAKLARSRRKSPNVLEEYDELVCLSHAGNIVAEIREQNLVQQREWKSEW